MVAAVVRRRRLDRRCRPAALHSPKRACIPKIATPSSVMAAVVVMVTAEPAATVETATMEVEVAMAVAAAVMAPCLRQRRRPSAVAISLATPVLHDDAVVVQVELVQERGELPIVEVLDCIGCARRRSRTRVCAGARTSVAAEDEW